MILKKQPRIMDVNALLTGLQAARQGVLRVEVGDAPGKTSELCSAWLVTDTLVAFPDFVARAQNSVQSSYTCSTSSDPVEFIPADLVFGFISGPWGSRPALLRLRQAILSPALVWRDAGVEVGEPAFLLHYPQGQLALELSIGSVIGIDGTRLRYDADTLPGSSGCPILDSRWQLVGMHMAAGSPGPVGPGSFNQGLTLPAILDALRQTPVWGEIARYHNLADAGAARTALQKEITPPAPTPTGAPLLRAAVCWDVDPQSFSAEDRERLKPLVLDPSAERWVLQTKERERLLRSAGSLEALREARGRQAAEGVRQQVIDRILQGPPYPLDDVEEAALPYWLQAVRWFADVAPGLPTPAEVNRTLERRRVRSRLEAITGPSFQGPEKGPRTTGPVFRGRDPELKTLGEWYGAARPGPLVLSGIGGIGKSALIAKFSLGLPTNTLLLWLDFDRADLAPDDAVSMLRLLTEQVAVQTDGFTPREFDPASWQDGAKWFGGALARTQRGAPAPLLVLDSFEVAQHVRRHVEIWELLELILDKIPRLRVLVSGRAPVTDVKLHDRPSTPLHLTGLARPDAKKWLQDFGVADEAVLDRVVDLTYGVPLALALALRWLQAGGDVQQLPEALPNELVTGFLYQRILDRVIDASLKPVARGALVLRRLTAEMIPEVLGDTLPQGTDAAEVFARLAQEMALVDAGGAATPWMPVASSATPDVLQLRPEVRTATLRLLEREDEEHVRLIDERAAAWYAKQNLDELANRAELVYHRLRLGDIAGAEAVWRDDCAAFLLFAVDDLPEKPGDARAWLRERTGGANMVAANLEAWENDAARRIRVVIRRELLRAVPEILAERSKRSTASPLVLYDAWWRWRGGDLAGARGLLQDAGEATGPAGRDRAVLAAALAAQAGDRPEANRLLVQVEDPELWRDRENGALEALAAQAARVRLTIDLAAELELDQMLSNGPDGLASTLFLTPPDVVLPSLAQRMEFGFSYESSVMSLQVPADVWELPRFAVNMDDMRRRAWANRSPLLPERVASKIRSLYGQGGDLFLPIVRLSDARAVDSGSPWSGRDLGLDAATQDLPNGSSATAVARGLDLAVLGWRRWLLATRSLFLSHACERALQPGFPDWLSLSVVGTLAAFSGGRPAGFDLQYRDAPLEKILVGTMFAAQRTASPPLTVERVSFAARFFRQLLAWYPEVERLAEWLVDAEKRILGSPDKPVSLDVLGILAQEQCPLALYLLGPEPLDILVRRIIGLSDSSIL